MLTDHNCSSESLWLEVWVFVWLGGWFFGGGGGFFHSLCVYILFIYFDIVFCFNLSTLEQTTRSASFTPEISILQNKPIFLYCI